ncbi:MAG: hypothetical protein V4543_11235 [Bacteroidota bacterium]
MSLFQISSKTLLRSLMVAGVIALASPAFAQDPGDPGDLGPTPSAQPAGVPIDGGASLLAAAGISYGLKRVRARKKAKAALAVK